MFCLTERLKTLEIKLDSGFQRLDEKLETLEKRVGQKLDDSAKSLFDKLDLLGCKLKSFEQDFT